MVCIMRITLLLLLLSTLAATAAAQVYRSVGPDGSVHFSDQPEPGATPVEIRPVVVVPPAATPPPRPGSSSPSAAVSGYRSFMIASPTEDEGVRANDGNVSVSLALDPPLAPEHRVLILLDGQPVGDAGTSLTVTLPNLDRGTHRLEASVVDGRGTPVMSTPPVTFHVLRVSILSPPVAVPAAR
jgi:hypothetical protein